MPIYDGIEFDVVFDGAHRDQDADLLTAAAIPEKPTPSPRRDGTQVVYDALPTSDAAGVTLKDLVTRTQLTPAAVNNALYRLRHWGRLQTSTDRSYRAPQRYWRKDEDGTPTTAASNDQILGREVLDWLARG
jgi:hypothetical protein